MKRLVVLIGVLCAGYAQAQMTVKQINGQERQIAVTGARSLTVGDQLVYTHEGRQCTLPVVSKNGDFAIASLEDCSLKSSIRVGHRVEKSLFTSPARTTQSFNTRSHISGMSPELKESLKGFSVYAYYSFAADANAVGENEQDDKERLEIKGDRAFGVGGEYQATHGLGSGIRPIFGASYELERDYDKVRQNRRVQEIPNGGVQLSNWILYGNLALPFNPKIQGLAGVNYSIPMEQGAELKLDGKVGYQFGGSFRVTEQLAIDGIYRYLNYENDEDYEVSIDGLVVRGRFIF